MSDLSVTQTHDTSPGPHLASVGFFAAGIALLIACTALGFSVWGAVTNHPVLSADIIEFLAIEDYVDRLTGAQLWAGLFFWCWVDLLGIALFWFVRGLFATYRAGHVFSVRAAHQLQRIGWIIFAMAPTDILAGLLGSVALSSWITGDTLHGQIAIDDTDIYAIIIGLVVVCVGHVMRQAAALDAENRSFV